MKKVLALLIVLTLCLGMFVGCGKTQEPVSLTASQVAGTWILKEGSGEGFLVGGFGSDKYAKKLELEKTGEVWAYEEVSDKTSTLARWTIAEDTLKIADDNEYCVMYFELIDDNTLKATKGTAEYIKSE